ncbi:hypothetical protein [Paraprevotella xylaniphila]|uniref:hypothetical protein n=1 Tax=Paraprevotella xylaniphila TaxID=454155 RepID=UPI00266B8FB8|nr:hypothetical protein [Paraprevotella xylaniphila]
MKKALKFLSWMFILLFTVSVSSCKDDDDDAPADAATAIARTYSGTMTRTNGYTGAVDKEGRGFITVTRVSASEVNIEIKSDETNVDIEALVSVVGSGDTYILTKEGWDFNGNVNLGVLTVNFGSNSYDFKFVGERK